MDCSQKIILSVVFVWSLTFTEKNGLFVKKLFYPWLQEGLMDVLCEKRKGGFGKSVCLTNRSPFLLDKKAVRLEDSQYPVKGGQKLIHSVTEQTPFHTGGIICLTGIIVLFYEKKLLLRSTLSQTLRQNTPELFQTGS